MTGDDEQQQGLPVFRDLGHSLSIAVTDMVQFAVRTRCRALWSAASGDRTSDQSNLASGIWSSWIPPVPMTAGCQPYSRLALGPLGLGFAGIGGEALVARLLGN